MAIEPDIVVAVGRRADSTVTIANLRGQVYGERTFDTAHVPAVDPDQHDWSNYVLAAYQVRAATRPRNQWQRPPTLPSDADGGRVAFRAVQIYDLEEPPAVNKVPHHGPHGLNLLFDGTVPPVRAPRRVGRTGATVG